MSKEDLIRGLNEDLAAEWGTIIRYTQQASKSFGIMGGELREMFAREVQDELGYKKVGLIAMGRRGLGDLEGLLLGSVSHKVTQLAHCPCLTVK